MKFPQFTHLLSAAVLLWEERKRQLRTQAEAVELTGLPREVICRLETQPGDATLKTLERFARGLGFDFEITLAPHRFCGCPCSAAQG
jgi:hypothetical protein